LDEEDEVFLINHQKMSQGRKKVVDHCKITPFEPHDGKLPS
jgi:hypothetical protein